MSKTNKATPLWVTIPDRVPLYVSDYGSVKKSKNKDPKSDDLIPIYIEVKDEQ